MCESALSNVVALYTINVRLQVGHENGRQVGRPVATEDIARFPALQISLLPQDSPPLSQNQPVDHDLLVV